MPCYHPLPVWYGSRRNESGKRPIVFKLADAYKDRPLQVPCGKCIGCQLERSRQWALRCVHECKLHEENCFITLTYETVPDGGSLVPSHFVDFLKRLRYHAGEFRYIMCGEYGEALSRPHYHALLFGLSFPDAKEHSTSGENKLYTSAFLDKVWSHGYCMIGEASFDSAAYIARYALKKVVGPRAASWYQGRVPEYMTMSRRPGIGRGFIEKFRKDVYPSDECVVRGTVCKPPRYYDDVVSKMVPSVVKRVKSRRRAMAERSEDNTGKRLLVREVVKESAISTLSRKLEV